jgi:hypothetical protein
MIFRQSQTPGGSQLRIDILVKLTQGQLNLMDLLNFDTWQCRFRKPSGHSPSAPPYRSPSSDVSSLGAPSRYADPYLHRDAHLS